MPNYTYEIYKTFTINVTETFTAENELEAEGLAEEYADALDFDDLAIGYSCDEDFEIELLESDEEEYDD